MPIFKKINEEMKSFLKENGFEPINRPDKRIFHEINGVHDENTFFIETKEKFNEIGDDSFIVFTFKELFLYKRENFRNNCIEKIVYKDKEEVLDFLHKYAKIKENWHKEIFMLVEDYIIKNYHTYIKNQHDDFIELSLPYNHSSSKEQSLFIFSTQISLQFFKGGIYSGKWEVISNHDFRNIKEFSNIIFSFYNPKTVWDKEFIL